METEAQDISSYIPTNLISITDGQIYLSPRLFQKGILAGGGRGQVRLPCGRQGPIAGLPRRSRAIFVISYSQFEELESFSRFGTRLDEATRRVLERGWRIREILKQPQYKPMPASEQIAALMAVTGGALDHVPVSDVGPAETKIRNAAREQIPDICTRIEDGQKLSTDDFDTILHVAEKATGMPQGE